ncbi:MAG: ATP-binding protein [Candidatus Margulisiibacteriota bacterium]
MPEEIINNSDLSDTAEELKRLSEENRLIKNKLEINKKTSSENDESIKTLNKQLKIKNDLLKEVNHELKTAYAELKDTHLELVHAEKAEVVGNLAIGVAHEVKNPLTIILQGTRYLMDKIQTDDKEVSYVLESIHDAVIRADGIIDGLVAFSSSSNLDKEPADLNIVIETQLKFEREKLSRDNIQINEELDKKLPLLKINRHKIGEVFNLLIYNAAAAMPEGGQLTIRTFMNNTDDGGLKKVIAQVEDTGTGIPDDIIGKIYNPFFTTKRNKGGKGLGLSIVKNIIDLHNGEILIENKKSKGVIATITFNLTGKEIS